MLTFSELAEKSKTKAKTDCAFYSCLQGWILLTDHIKAEILNSNISCQHR